MPKFSVCPCVWAVSESTTTRTAGGLVFIAIGGKRQGREVPQSLRVEPDACQWPYRSMSGMVWIFVRRTEKQANISSQSLRLWLGAQHLITNNHPVWKTQSRRCLWLSCLSEFLATGFKFTTPAIYTIFIWESRGMEFFLTGFISLS